MPKPLEDGVTPHDLIHLGNIGELPYLKHVELTKLTPAHFGLNKWQRMIPIPDFWMRRIYRQEIWKDADHPNPTPAGAPSAKQRDLLSKWLMFDSPFSLVRQMRGISAQRHQQPFPSNDLLDILDNCEHQSSSPSLLSEDEFQFHISDLTEISTGHDDESNPLVIGHCRGHKIQPEKEIARQAIERMNQLSEEDELKVSTLMKDEEFMNFLKEQVRRYLQGCGYALQ